MNLVVIGFYGKSDSGKTSLIERLIKEFNEDGFKVATIKITDKKISIDSEGKDTWKHSQAGAGIIVLSSPAETDFIVKDKIETNEIIKQISLFGEYDIVLVEGANDPDILKIRLGNIKERKNTIYHYNDDFEEVVKLIKKKINEN